mgnify:CR=1 FL=1
MAVAGEEDAVRSVVMDYVEGWFEGDAGRMKRALHPELVKRCRGIEGDDPDALETLSARQMIDATYLRALASLESKAATNPSLAKQLAEEKQNLLASAPSTSTSMKNTNRLRYAK